MGKVGLVQARGQTDRQTDMRFSSHIHIHACITNKNIALNTRVGTLIVATIYL